MRQVTGAPELVARLPRAICRRLAALPTRADPATGTIEVAAADPLDPHVSAEIGFHLGAQIRVLRAPIAAVEEALRRLELDDTDTPERVLRPRRATPASPYGAPQSSIPPPVLDEAPIPLVRKAPGGDAGASRAAEGGPRRGATLVPPAGAPPLAGVVLPGPRPPVSIPQPPPTAPYPGTERAGPFGDASPHAAHAAHADREPPREPLRDRTAVSFPSVPPAGERVTPPYGTPVYSGSNPPPPDPGYRIAPPGDDPLPKTRATPDGPAPFPPPSPRPPPLAPSPRPARPTLMSAAFDASSTAAAPRRPARPPLGDMPYPAAIPSHPTTPGSRRGALPDEEDDDVALAMEPRRARPPTPAPCSTRSRGPTRATT